MSIADEYDSPWKQVLERFLQLFLAFFFPVVHQGIDWSRGYEFLDTELQVNRLGNGAITGVGEEAGRGAKRDVND